MLYVLDNNSGMSEFGAIRKVLKNYPNLDIRSYVSETNLGFAGGHQFLFEQHNAEFFILINDDALFEPDYIQKTLQHLKSNPEVGGVQGVVLRWGWESGSPKKTPVIDTLGLHRKQNGKVEEIASGKGIQAITRRDPYEVMGISGCVPMFRRSSVESVHPEGKLFDPEFIIYKEDVELAMRLQSANIPTMILPSARAYHYRSFTRKRRKSMHPDLEFYSYRNHLWTLLIHRSPKLVIGRFFQTVFFEMAKLGYFLFKRPWILSKTVGDTWKHRKFLAKRRKFLSSA